MKDETLELKEDRTQPLHGPPNAVLTGSTVELRVDRVAERRRAIRFCMDLDVRYRTLNCDAETVEGTGRSLNISSSGMSLTSQSPVPVGRVLELFVDWPVRLPDGCFVQLVARGRVTRVTQAQIAVEFHKYQFRTQSRLLRGTDIAERRSAKPDGMRRLK